MKKIPLQNKSGAHTLMTNLLTNLNHSSTTTTPYLMGSKNDDLRIIVTRWRLSCHKLHVETGRYKKPKVERNQRLCKMCGVVEDEHHALLVCDAHHAVRIKFRDQISWTSVSDMLNPENENDLIVIAAYIKEIEKNMEALKLVQ